MAVEDRLEELFMSDAHNRRVTSVDVPQRPSPWRGVVVFAGVAAIAGIALVAVILGLRGGQQAASPTATATATVIPSATSIASPSPVKSSPPTLPPASGGSLYSSPAGYGVILPDGWRRSDLQSRLSPKDNPDELSIETFTTRTTADEAAQLARSDTGLGPAQYLTAFVAVNRNSRSESAMEYAQRVKGLYGLAVVSVEPTTVDGRAGVKTTFKFSGADPQSFYTLYVQDGERMWVIGYVLKPAGAQIPPGATEPAVRGIVESFRFAG